MLDSTRSKGATDGMVSRSPRQSKIDDAAFPLRVNINVPETGLGVRLNEAMRWLNDCVGQSDYAIHGAGRQADHAAAFYFRHPNALTDFLKAFPDFELADRVGGVGYTAPGCLGRKAAG